MSPRHAGPVPAAPGAGCARVTATVTGVRAARLHRALEDARTVLHDHIDRQIGELRQALTHVAARTDPLGSRLAEITLRELTDGETTGVQVGAYTVMAVTAEFFGFTVDDLQSARKVRPLVHARHIAMFLCRELTDLSLPRIGHAFDRDHTTVKHGVDKIRGDVDAGGPAARHVRDLSGLVKERAAIQTARDERRRRGDGS